ncbi:MAG: ABC transporter ATP-binding protein [Rickettsiales bacterium]
MSQALLSVRNVVNRFGEQPVHDDISFDVQRGEIIGVVGGSGAGKSVLLRTMTGLHRPNSGEVRISGRDVRSLAPNEIAKLFGVLFQQGALFSSLTVAENIMLPLREHTDLPEDIREQIAAMKLTLADLQPEVGAKFPNQLSGGMIKRAALARALALDPPILFLDEPTAGLDPLTAASFDALILKLNRSFGVTVVMVTHDLDSLLTLCDRIAVLVDRSVIIDTVEGMMHNTHPWIHQYFHGPRARAVAWTRGAYGK